MSIATVVSQPREKLPYRNRRWNWALRLVAQGWSLDRVVMKTKVKRSTLFAKIAKERALYECMRSRVRYDA